MVVDLSVHRDGDGVVLIEERLVTRSRVNNGKPLVSQIAVTVLVETTPVWTTVLQSAGELEDADSFGLRVIGATKNSKNST